MAVPVRECDQIQEATAHRNVSDVGAPDLVKAVNHNILEKKRPNSVLWMLLAYVGYPGGLAPTACGASDRGHGAARICGVAYGWGRNSTLRV